MLLYGGYYLVIRQMLSSTGSILSQYGMFRKDLVYTCLVYVGEIGCDVKIREYNP